MKRLFKLVHLLVTNPKIITIDHIDVTLNIPQWVSYLWSCIGCHTKWVTMVVMLIGSQWLSCLMGHNGCYTKWVTMVVILNGSQCLSY